MKQSECQTIMIVDDDPLVLESLSELLLDEGFSVIASLSPDEALCSLASEHPALCITDLNLQGMSGEEFAIKLRSISPDTIIIVHTGSAYTPSPAMTSIGVDPAHIIQKPILDFSAFLAKIRQLSSEGFQ